MRNIYDDKNNGLKAGFDAEAKFSFVTKDTRPAGESDKDELQASGKVDLQIEMHPTENLQVELHDQPVGTGLDASSIVLHYQAGPVNISLGNVELPGIRGDYMDGIMLGYNQADLGKVKIFAGSESNIAGGAKLNVKETIKGINAEADVANYHLGITHIGKTNNRKERNELSVEGPIGGIGGLFGFLPTSVAAACGARAEHDAEGNPVATFKYETDLNDSSRNKAEIEIAGVASIKYERDDDSFQSQVARASGYTGGNAAANRLAAARNTESWSINYQIADGIEAEFESRNFRTNNAKTNNRNYKDEKLSLQVVYDDFPEDSKQA